MVLWHAAPGRRALNGSGGLGTDKEPRIEPAQAGYGEHIAALFTGHALRV